MFCFVNGHIVNLWIALICLNSVGFAIICFGSSIFNFVLKRDLLQIFPCIFRSTACDLFSVRPKCPQMDKILLHQNIYAKLVSLWSIGNDNHLSLIHI